VFALHYALTISVLPYHTHSTEIAEEAQRRGLEVMLHLPMRAIANETPEAHELEAGMSGEEAARMLNGMLESVPTADGVNNHEGFAGYDGCEVDGGIDAVAEAAGSVFCG